MPTNPAHVSAFAQVGIQRNLIGLELRQIKLKDRERYAFLELSDSVFYPILSQVSEDVLVLRQKAWLSLPRERLRFPHCMSGKLSPETCISRPDKLWTNI